MSPEKLVQRKLLTVRRCRGSEPLDFQGHMLTNPRYKEHAVAANSTQTEVMMQQRTTRVNRSEETIKTGPLGIRFLLTGDDSSGSVSVFELLVPGGQKLPAPAHKNDAYEEMLYGIEGVLTWTVGGTPMEVGPGQALCIPRGAVHRFDNLGSEDAKQLAVITPAIMGPAYFREAAEVIGAAGGG